MQKQGFVGHMGEPNWAGKKLLFLAWFDYLALSPSYDLARRLTNNDAPRGVTLPDDIDLVLDIYRDFGDVQHSDLMGWWRSNRISLFGQPGDDPTIEVFGTLSPNGDRQPPLDARLMGYRENAWVDQDRPGMVIVGVPAGLPDADMLKAIHEAFERESVRDHEPEYPAAKYLLQGGKHHMATVARYWRVLKCRSDKVDMPLWQVGLTAGVSDTHAPEPITDAAVLDGAQHDKQSLKVLTLRALNRGHAMAENAARGIFPSHKPHEHALALDYDKLAELSRRREKWLTAFRAGSAY